MYSLLKHLEKFMQYKYGMKLPKPPSIRIQGSKKKAQPDQLK